MPDILVYCPSCQQEYSIDSSTLGRQFKCVQCGQTFTASAPSVASPPPQNSAPAPLAPPASFGSAGSFSQQPPGVPPTYLGEAPPGAQPRSNAALWAMICGFLCWIWPVSIAALVLGIIGVGKTRNSQLRGGGMAVTGIVLGGIGLILDPIVGLCLSIMLPAMHQARLAANGVLAQSNMQQIGVALQSYENQNQGAYPPDLETLISNQRLSPALFVYPGGSDTPADSVNALESGGHLSYVYLGGGKTDLSDTDRVVLYEDGRGHLERSVRGLNLLYADGHVDFESKANADLKINQTRNALKLPPVGN